MRLPRRALLGAGPLVAALSLPALSLRAAAQSNWPSRPIRLVVPYAAGGGTDILARALGEALRGTLPQPVVVENRAGASGVLGTEVVARAEPDGHTLLAVVSTHVMNRYYLQSLPYDPAGDFTPIAMLARNTMVLVASAQQPFTDLAGLAAEARRRPGAIGTGSTEALSSFIGQELARRLKLDMPDVQYRSGGQLMNDIVAGHLPTGWTSTSSATPHMPTGRVRLIATSNATRTPFYPDLPTVMEQGVPEFDLAGWVALLGPKGMNPAISARLQAALQKAYEDPTLRQRFTTLGIEPDLRDGPGLRQAMEREDRLWAGAAAAGTLRRQE